MNSKKSQNISTNPERSREGSQRASASYGTNKTLLFQIIFVVVIAGGLLMFEKLINREDPDLTNKNRIGEAALFIDFDNMQRMFEGDVFEKMTVLDALNASVAAGKIKLTYFVDGSNSTKVTEINDHSAEGDAEFTFYINSDKIDPSELNRKYVQPGDKITIRLE